MRQALSILLPLLAPTLIYIYFKTRSGATALDAARNAPWVWLAGGGAVLAAALLTILALTSGAPSDAEYVPPHMENGRVVPGRLVPKDASGS